MLLKACTAPVENRKKDQQLHIVQTRLLPQLSSGSGIVLYNGAAFVISDNVNGFFKMDTASFEQYFYPFTQGDSVIIQPKDVKEDLENACLLNLNGTDHIIAFGSGSVEGTREKILIFPVAEPGKHQVINGSPFYLLLRQRLGIPTAQLNLEGCFSSPDSIYLLNRGTNQSVAMSKGDLQKMINTGFDQLPPLSIQSFTLPELDSFPVAFSGACYFKDDLFLFTASVEKTKDWVADGEVAGSYIGMARLNGSVVFLLPLKNAEGNMIKQKLESIDIVGHGKDGSISVFAISDNDNGESTWFRVVIK